MSKPLTRTASVQPRRFAVIGAGWAGCAAAITLQDAGCRVTLFEAAREPGGRARAVALDGRRLDNGQHILLGAYSETLRLMRSIGVVPERVLMRLPLQMCYPEASGITLVARRLPAPFHLAVALLRATGLKREDKLALLRFISAMRWMDWQLDQDCTVAEFLAVHGQTPHLYRVLWRPLCLAALNTAPDMASAKVFLSVLRDSLGARRAASDMLIPRTDLGTLLPLAAGRHLAQLDNAVRTGVRVERLTPCDDLRWRVHADAGSVEEQFDGVVIATPSGEAARLMDGHADVSSLAGFDHEAIATAYLQFDPAVRLPRPFFALLDDPAQEKWGQFVFDRGQFDERHAGLLAVVISSANDAMAIGRQTLLGTLARQVAEAFNSPTLLRPSWSRLIVEKRATFSCRPNLVRPTNDTGVPGLWLAGDYTAGPYPATLEGAVRSGVQAARLALGQETVDRRSTVAD